MPAKSIGYDGDVTVETDSGIVSWSGIPNTEFRFAVLEPVVAKRLMSKRLATPSTGWLENILKDMKPGQARVIGFWKTKAETDKIRYLISNIVRTRLNWDYQLIGNRKLSHRSMAQEYEPGKWAIVIFRLEEPVKVN